MSAPRIRTLAGLTGLGLALVCALAPQASAADAARERSIRVDRDELFNTGGWALSDAAGEGSEGVRIPHADYVLRFEYANVNVNGPCNLMRGDYALKGKKMTFHVAPTTRQACDDARNLADQRFAALIDGTFRAEIVTSTNPYRLRLIADDGRRLEFEALPLPF